ncbi:MAG: GNAT family N-acetyltransferase [Polyangiaceae bacterium]|nr:GNAT family N-acetyltransferase [Polyangiaceae bacterium]
MSTDLLGMKVRRLRSTDSFEELTHLLHRAYAPLAAAGMRFFATHQTVRDTKDRALLGECYVIDDGKRLLGTITLKHPARAGASPGRVSLYNRPDVCVFNQLGVEPSLKGRGLGRLLMETVEKRAVNLGARGIACDTAETAEELRATYERRGFVFAEHVQWDETNYRSVVLVKWFDSAVS